MQQKHPQQLLCAANLAAPTSHRSALIQVLREQLPNHWPLIFYE